MAAITVQKPLLSPLEKYQRDKELSKGPKHLFAKFTATTTATATATAAATTITTAAGAATSTTTAAIHK
jgi:hypothetical protein